MSLAAPTLELVRASPLFTGVSTVRMAQLATVAGLRRLAAGESLLARDDTSDDVYLVVSGTLRIIVHAPNGRALLFRDLGPGETIGELAAIDGRPRSASAEAQGAAEVVRIPGGAFRELVASEPALAVALLRRAVHYIRDLSERLYELSSLAVANRIHAELLRRTLECGVTAGEAILSPAPRHADIAERIATSREAVTRELSRLARVGLIERRGKALVVRDVARLRQLVEIADPH